MQRLYSMFPQGGPGLGLLLLRLATAAMFALNLTHHFSFSSPALHWFFFSLIALISFLLCIGLFTPILASIACITAVSNLFLGDQSIVYAFRVLTAAALIFLGPGAYSVDAKLFGLRVTVIPPRKEKNQQQFCI